MTGAQLTHQLLNQIGATDIRVRRGGRDSFRPRERLITLTPKTWHGAKPACLAKAAHEVAHVAQAQHRIAILACWIFPLLVLMEWDASRRAMAMLKASGMDPRKLAQAKAALDSCLATYLRSLAWRACVAVAILCAGWLARR